MALPTSPTHGQQVEEPIGSGNWFEYDANLIAPGVGGWKSIPPPGGPGPSGDRFQQNFASALTHTVTHGLNVQYPFVQCIDASGNAVIPSVAFTSANVVTLNWSEPVAATVVVRR